MKVTREQGFTLIEVIVTVAIIAILAVIALPAYQDYVRKARRADGRDALLYIQNLQERWRANHSTYSSSLSAIGYSGSTATTSQEGYYNVSISVAPSAPTGNSFVIEADPTGIQATDTDCDPMKITVSATYPRGQKTPVSCW